VPEWIQTYEKTGGFKLPPRETTAAPLRKSWVVLTYRRTKLFCCNAAKIAGGFDYAARKHFAQHGENSWAVLTYRRTKLFR